MPCGFTLQICRMLCDFVQNIFIFFWNVSCTKELENSQLYQHSRLSNSFDFWEQSGKIPNHKRDTAKRWCIPQIPSSNVPSPLILTERQIQNHFDSHERWDPHKRKNMKVNKMSMFLKFRPRFQGKFCALILRCFRRAQTTVFFSLPPFDSVQVPPA